MRQSRLTAMAGVFLAAALSAPAWGADPAQSEHAKANPARPGSLNYIEGQASIEGQGLGPEAIGKTELKPGQSLETGVGKAELLLTPGVFLRLGDNSSVMMISPTLTDTELRLDKGEATVEIAELHPENNIVIAEDGAKIRLTKTGLYDFDADHSLVRVYQGEANVEVNGQDIKVENEHQLAFGAGASMKPEKFDKEVQDDLYRWSSLRSSYLAEANVDRAQDYQVGSYGAGWDWDPYYGAYTFVPGDGIFYSPFGWGFYSAFDVGFAPFFFFGHFDHDFDRDFDHFRDRDRGDRGHGDRGHGDREHGGDRGHGDRGRGGDMHGDRGHGGEGGREAHYYDHFDHGSYHGPGHSNNSGFNGGGVVAAGSRVGFHGGQGFNGGHSGEGFHGGGGSMGSRGMGGVQGGGAGHVGGGGHAGGGAQGGGGFHGGGGGGHAGGGGFGGGHAGGGGGHH